MKNTSSFAYKAGKVLAAICITALVTWVGVAVIAITVKLVSLMTGWLF